MKIIISLILVFIFILLTGCEIDEELITTAVSIESTHKCESRGLDFTCITMSSTSKTCYTLSDIKGGKRCLVEPYWEEIIYEEPTCPECSEPECPANDCSICPKEIETRYITKYVTKPCSSGGGSCSPCKVCGIPEGCNPTWVIGYTDDGKYVCPGIGNDVICTKNGDLSQIAFCDIE